MVVEEEAWAPAPARPPIANSRAAEMAARAKAAAERAAAAEEEEEDEVCPICTLPFVGDGCGRDSNAYGTLPCCLKASDGGAVNLIHLRCLNKCLHPNPEGV